MLGDRRGSVSESYVIGVFGRLITVANGVWLCCSRSFEGYYVMDSVVGMKYEQSSEPVDGFIVKGYFVISVVVLIFCDSSAGTSAIGNRYYQINEIMYSC